MQWLSVLLIGRSEKSGPPTVAKMQWWTTKWWTTRGEHASDKRTHQQVLLRECATTWGQNLVHIFDQGFAGGPWLQVAFGGLIRFVMRWRSSYTLIDEAGVERKAWQITKGKRSWQHRDVWDGDAPHQCYRRTGVIAAPVRHPCTPSLYAIPYPLYPAPLWLVVSRPGKGREPWYLLTSEPILTAELPRTLGASSLLMQGGKEVADRDELPLRQERTGYGKSPFVEMGEPPEAAVDGNSATLVYAFLLSLLDPSQRLLRQWLLRWWCHRSGKRNREASVPLYRLRSAISRLWLDYRPPSPAIFFP
jgi:hypothetical protein